MSSYSPSYWRTFNVLHQELSLAVNQNIPRWHLWTSLHEAGYNPAHLQPSQASAYCLSDELTDLLRTHSYFLSLDGREALARYLRKYNPRHETPEEIMERITNACCGRPLP